MPDFSVIIPSARASNLTGCLESIFKNEPSLPRERIFVIDDGAKLVCNSLFPGLTWIPGIKPFVFARNINLGIRAAGTDVIIFNDDARLKTKDGFSILSRFMTDRPDVGICSSAIEGYVGNPNQEAGPRGFRTDGRVIAFISIYIPKAVYEIVGPLDERFTAYGGDDMDYCDRVLKAGLLLGIHGDSIVTHGEVPSTFRSREDAYGLFLKGLQIYESKKRDG